VGAVALKSLSCAEYLSALMNLLSFSSVHSAESKESASAFLARTTFFIEPARA